MKTNIYLDTTIVSALFDERTPERMAQTKQFWEFYSFGKSKNTTNGFVNEYNT
jgi:hypothetical protein